MADSNVGIKLSAEGVGQVEEAFRRVAKGAEGFEKKATILSSVIGKLAGVVAGLFAVRKIADFFIAGTKAAIEDQQAMGLMQARLASIGVEYETARPKVEAYLKSMINLGREDEAVALSMSKLATKTKSLDEGMRLSKLASDLAASGIGDLESNTDSLARILMGKGARALLQFGVTVRENATIAEQLAAVQQKVTRTTEQWAETTEGRVARMKVQYGELREQLGYSFLITITNLSNAFTDFYNKTAGDTESFAHFMGKTLNVSIPNWINQLQQNLYALRIMGLENRGFFSKLSDAQAAEQIEAAQKMIKALEDMNRERDIKFEQSWKDLKSATQAGAAGLTEPLDEMAQKTVDAFGNLAKAIVGSMDEGIKKIKDLAEEIKNLADDTEESLAKSDEAHKKSLIEMARSSQGKIDQLDKEIAETKEKQDKGWRTRIAELEKEKAKEASIIKRIGGEIVNIQGEIQKDALTVLEEAHAKEIQEIKDQAEKKRLELQKEQLEYQIAITKGMIETTTPGYFAKATETEVGLRPWEVSPGATVFNFDFTNATVTDIEALKKVLLEAINRSAALKNAGG